MSIFRRNTIEPPMAVTGADVESEESKVRAAIEKIDAQLGELGERQAVAIDAVNDARFRRDVLNVKADVASAERAEMELKEQIGRLLEQQRRAKAYLAELAIPRTKAEYQAAIVEFLEADAQLHPRVAAFEKSVFALIDEFERLLTWDRELAAVEARVTRLANYLGVEAPRVRGRRPQVRAIGEAIAAMMAGRRKPDGVREAFTAKMRDWHRFTPAEPHPLTRKR